MRDELEERRVEELTDVLRWLLFAPALAFRVFSQFQTTEMDRFTAYGACDGPLVRGWSVALLAVIVRAKWHLKRKKTVVQS